MTFPNISSSSTMRLKKRDKIIRKTKEEQQQTQFADKKMRVRRCGGGVGSRGRVPFVK
jgi:hypothetical protein